MNQRNVAVGVGLVGLALVAADQGFIGIEKQPRHVEGYLAGCFQQTATTIDLNNFNIERTVHNVATVRYGPRRGQVVTTGRIPCDPHKDIEPRRVRVDINPLYIIRVGPER